MKKAPILIFAFLLSLSFSCGEDSSQSHEEYDVVIYGATSAGIIAAYTAKTMGKSVMLIEPSQHLGGLTTGGLGYTDIGNKYAVTGLSRDFYRRLGQHYGKFEQWIFEPSVAKAVFEDYLDRAGISVHYGYRVIDTDKSDGVIREIELERSDNPSPDTNLKVS